MHRLDWDASSPCFFPDSAAQNAALHRPTWAVIHTDHFRHNLKILHQRMHQVNPNAKMMAVIKTNAYGHDLGATAQFLQNTTTHTPAYLGVESLEHGIHLRQQGITLPIVILQGIHQPDHVAIASIWQLSLVVHMPDHVHWIQAWSSTTSANDCTPLAVWLKVDTGMGRLGFGMQEMTWAYDQLMACAHVQRPLTLMSHFACADQVTHPLTRMQIQRFITCTQGLPVQRTLANSAALYHVPEACFDVVRVGLALYGLSPFADKTGAQLGLRPVMTMRSRLISIHTRACGQGIGYGQQMVCAQETRVGIVAFGYADGYPLNGHQHQVQVAGVMCPVLGRPSMDSLAVDVTGVHDAYLGQEVVLWGQELPAEHVAARGGIHVWNLLTNVHQRVQRVWG